jgi:hypothetical protein
VRRIAAFGALLCLPVFATAADCSKLDGTYRFKANGATGTEPAELSGLSTGPERRNLFKYEGPPPTGGLSSTQPRTRPKVTVLATSATLAYAPKNTRLKYMDATGKVLAKSRIDSPDPWTCKGERLVRSLERTGGLGNAIRTERVEEVLERDAAGNLVHRESTTIIEGCKGSHKKESVYAAVR